MVESETRDSAKLEQKSKRERKPLTFFISGGGSLFRAICPELDIKYYGPSRKETIAGLMIMADGEVHGIIEGRGGPNDDRVELARLVRQQLETSGNPISSLFKKGIGPGPFYPGL